MMDTILEEIEEVDSFVDDVVQYSKNFTDMLKTLRRVFPKISRYRYANEDGYMLFWVPGLWNFADM